MRNLVRPLRGIVSSLTCATALLILGACKSIEDEGDSTAGASDYPPAAIPEVEKEHRPAVSNLDRSQSKSILVGDTLELFVEEDDSFNGRYSVRERGDIIIPSLGRIPVSGMSVVDAGSRIRSELESTHLKRATVLIDRVGRAPVKAQRPSSHSRSIANSTSSFIKVYMTGKVARAGQHRMPIPKSGNLGVYEAILIAGGLSQFADPQRVYLLRSDDSGKKHKIPVNIRSIENGIAMDPSIGDGDIVVVPEKVFGF